MTQEFMGVFDLQLMSMYFVVSRVRRRVGSGCSRREHVYPVMVGHPVLDEVTK